MTELFNGIIYTFGSSSALTAVIQYEKRRSGANMQYRFYYKIYISDRNKNPNPYGSYQNNLRIIFNLNGGDVLTRNIKSSSSGWSFEYTSDWFSVAKTTGTTPFKFTIKDTQNSSWCNYSSTTYNLTVDPAGSDLQTISNFNIGTPFTVSITKYADMYDVLTIKIGSTTIKTINNASTTNPITFNSSELNTIYGLTVNDASKDFTFELKTFENSSSSTQVGTTKTKTAKGYIVASNPTINSLTAVDTNQNCIDLTGSNTKMVLGVSNVKVTVKASGVNKATIKSITVNNVTASNGIVTFNEATVNTFNVIVTDSRGFQTTNSITLQTINYILLTLSANVKRNQPTDGKVVISYSGNYFNGSFGDISNTLTVQYRYIEKGGSWDNVPWIDLTPTIKNNTYSQTLTIEGFDYQKQYIFEIIAKDELEEIYLSNIVLTKGYPIINWEDDFFNVNVDLMIKNKKIFDLIYPIGSIYISVKSTNPSNLFGGTWVAWGSGRVPVGINTNDSDFSTVEKTGGEKKHKLTIEEMPSHVHEMARGIESASPGSSNPPNTSWENGSQFAWELETGSTGGGKEHNNLQPYITCYMWKRTA